MKNKLFIILKELKGYIIIILIANLAISLACYFFNKQNQYSYFIVLLFSILSTIVEILIDGICAKIIHGLNDKHFDYSLKIYKQRKFEKKLFKIIKIHEWKDKIPEIGKMACNFGKDKLEDSSDISYLNLFIKETCVGEMVHLFSMIFGILVIFILPINYWLWIGLIVCIINIVLNIPLLLIQRYNRPRLLLLLKRANKKAIDQKNL